MSRGDFDRFRYTRGGPYLKNLLYEYNITLVILTYLGNMSCGRCRCWVSSSSRFGAQTFAVLCFLYIVAVVEPLLDSLSIDDVLDDSHMS